MRSLKSFSGALSAARSGACVTRRAARDLGAWSSLWGRRLAVAGLDALAPDACRGCDAPDGESAERLDGGFCAACRSRVEWTLSACGRCGEPMASPPPIDPARGAPGACGACSAFSFHFDAVAAGGLHTQTLRTAVLRFKFHHDVGVLPLLVQALARAVRSPAAAPLVERAEVIVPVPLHPWKRWWRGWSPALVLARSLAGVLQPRALPVVEAVRKTRWTPAQVRRKGAARRANLRGAFAPWRRPIPGTVILVDDVLTTGTTASECARALKRGGASQVVVIAAARSSPPR